MNNLRIGIRLAMGFGLLIAFSLAMLACGIYQLSNNNAQVRAMVAVPLEKERLASDWYGAIDTAMVRAMVVALSSDEALIQQLAKDAAASSQASGARQKRIGELLSAPEEKALFAKIAQQRETYLKARDAVTTAKQAGDVVRSKQISSKSSIPLLRNSPPAHKPCATINAKSSTRPQPASTKAPPPATWCSAASVC